MEYVGAWQKKRKHLFSLYQKELPPSVRILSGHPDSDPVPLELAIDTPGRDRLAAYLNRRGIETVVHYPAPFPFVPAFRSLGYKRGAFPRAEKLSRRILSLPLHHMMTPQDVRDVTRAVCAFFGV
jgi:dTDP-4-amino-4,6-dideoxygalactose transaminase